VPGEIYKKLGFKFDGTEVLLHCILGDRPIPPWRRREIYIKKLTNSEITINITVGGFK
jgi:hypothetical protein